MVVGTGALVNAGVVLEGIGIGTGSGAGVDRTGVGKGATTGIG